MPLYGDYADWWLAAKVDGVIGEKPISKNTVIDYECGSGARTASSPIRRSTKSTDPSPSPLSRTSSPRARTAGGALEAGADLRDRNGRKVVPLGLASIKKILERSASVLDLKAIEEGHREDNPARSNGCRSRFRSRSGHTWRWTSWRHCSRLRATRR